MSTTLRFGEDDCRQAYDEWRCNCGPAALAAILGKTLDEVRPACEQVGFASKRYMSPTMMQDAIPLAGGRIAERLRLPLDKRIACDTDYLPKHGLARIQWGGPWTAKGANPRWAYGATHWIAAFDGVVFDVNGGFMPFEYWEQTIVPAIVASIKRADGEWWITHSWEVEHA